MINSKSVTFDSSVRSNRRDSDPFARRESLRHSINDHVSHQDFLNQTIPKNVKKVRYSSSNDKEELPTSTESSTGKYSITLQEMNYRARQAMNSSLINEMYAPTKPQRNIDEQLEQWLFEIPPRTVVKRTSTGKAFSEEVEAKKKEFITRMSCVKSQLDCVTERVWEMQVELKEFYKKKDAEIIENEARNQALVEDGSFKYSMDPADMEWKTDLLYLQPKYHSVATKYEVMIDIVDNKNLKRQLRILLNDYRRMHLHSKCLADTDPAPKYLDDVRVWIQETDVPNAPQVIDISKETKEVHQNVCSDIIKLKELQDEIIGLRGLFEKASMETNNNIMSEHNKVLRIQKKNTMTAEPSILEADKVAGLKHRFRETLEGMMYEEEQLDDARETVESITRKIQDIDMKIADADVAFKAASQLTYRRSSAKDRFDSFLCVFSPAIVKGVDPMFRVLQDMARKESDQKQSVKDSKTAVGDNAIKLQTAKKKLKGVKQSTPNDDFIFSETANKINNRDLKSIVSVVVNAIDTYRDAIGPFFQRAMGRLQDESNNVKTAKPTDMDEGDIKGVYEDELMDPELSMHGKVITASRVNDFITAEISRIIKDTHKNSLDVIIEAQKNCTLVSELVNCAGPMVMKNMADMLKGISVQDDNMSELATKRKTKHKKANKNASASSKQLSAKTSTVLGCTGSTTLDVFRQPQCPSCSVSEKSSDISHVTKEPQSKKPGSSNKRYIDKKSENNFNKKTTASSKRSLPKKTSPRTVPGCRSGSITSNTSIRLKNNNNPKNTKSVSRSTI